jgi:hypothetical protein
MKKQLQLITLLSFFIVISSTIFFSKPASIPDSLRKEYDEEEMEEMEHESGEVRSAFIEARSRYDYSMIKDPGTGRIPGNIFDKEMEEARTIPTRGSRTGSGAQGADNLNNYIAAGPDSIGGRTRTVVFDKRYNGGANRVIISGSVSGGIYRSADGGANWSRVSPENDIHSLTSVVQDPRAGKEDIWYAGGGESVGNSADIDGSALYLGYGIWKSVNNGLSWTKLPLAITDLNGSAIGGGDLEIFDNPFDFVHRIAVDPTNGNVYVAGHRRLVRSTDGGTSWRVVFAGTRAEGSSSGQMDIAINPNGKVYLAVNGGLRDRPYRGVWTSTTGDANSYSRIAGGRTLGVDSVAGWRGNSYFITGIDDSPVPPDTSFGSRRIILALAPSNPNLVFVSYENGLDQDGGSPKPEVDLFKLDVSSGSNVWTNLSANMPDFPGQLGGVDPFETQDGYNLSLSVKPDDPNVILLGGVNLYRSTNGFTNPTGTAWIGGYTQAFASGLVISPSTHPDYHFMSFAPHDNRIVIAANDGGIQMTNNILATGGTQPVKWNMIRNYQTLQYYHVALDPVPGQMNFIGGSQDNGTQLRVDPSNFHTRIFSGDGGAAGIAVLNTNTYKLYGSSQLGDIYRYTPGDFTNITPSGLTPFPGIQGYGEFVTYFKLDQENADDIYYANFNRLFRTDDATNVNSSGWDELTGVAAAVDPSNPFSGTDIGIRALEVSRGPYKPSHALFIGTSDGKVFRLDDPRNTPSNTSPVDITPAQLDEFRNDGKGVNISDIAVNPNNDNEIMIVVSNYSVTSSSGAESNDFNIYWTNNAKTAAPTWKKGEGNLTLPSIRSCMIINKKVGSVSTTEYYVGTSVGLYSAINIASTLQANGQVNWVREGGNILNFALVNTMDLRPSDNTLLVGTHGNGLFYSAIGNPDYHPDQPTGINDPVRNDKNFITQTAPTIVQNTINYTVGNMFAIKKITLAITNLNGQVLLKKEAPYANGQLNLFPMPKGVYILSITSADDKQQYVRKIIKD